jgi:hypothetical protein
LNNLELILLGTQRSKKPIKAKNTRKIYHKQRAIFNTLFKSAFLPRPNHFHSHFKFIILTMIHHVEIQFFACTRV